MHDWQTDRQTNERTDRRSYQAMLERHNSCVFLFAVTSTAYGRQCGLVTWLLSWFSFISVFHCVLLHGHFRLKVHHLRFSFFLSVCMCMCMCVCVRVGCTINVCCSCCCLQCCYKMLNCLARVKNKNLQWKDEWKMKISWFSTKFQLRNIADLAKVVIFLVSRKCLEGTF